MINSRAALRAQRSLATATRSRLTSGTRSSFKPANIVRPLTCSTKLYKEDKRSTAATALDTAHQHEGSFSRTDKRIGIQHPEEHEFPKSAPVQGRGGLHFKRTLPAFSLEGRSTIVTGGARGLGLVMSQAAVISGSDVAIVDLNSISMSS